MSTDIFDKYERNRKFLMRCMLIHHDGVTEEEIRGYTNNETYIQGVLSFRRAFPDYTIDVEDITLDGDFAVVQGIFRGTHMGEFHGIPATYKTVVFAMMNKYHILDDKIVNAWPMFDQLAFFEQLGVIHKPG